MKSALGIIRYTTLETIRKGTLIAYVVIGALIILIFALGLRLSPDDGTVELFGLKIGLRAGGGIQGINPVDFTLLQLYSGAYVGIMFLGLFGTAGLIPSFLRKGTAELFLSKPMSRTTLIVSRLTGALSGIMINTIFYTVSIWLIFGLKTGAWSWGFLASALFTSYIFACMFSLATLPGVFSQSTGLAIMVAFIHFFFFSALLETREFGMYKIWDNAFYHRTLDILYYITPQLEAMKNSAGTLIAKLDIPAMRQLANIPQDFTILPFVYSTLSAGVWYTVSLLYFRRKDY